MKHPQATDRQRGFTLMDLVVSIAITSVSFAVVMLGFTRLWACLNLEDTATTLVYHLRDLQQMAESDSVYGQARLSVYTPMYQLYRGTTRLETVSFCPGVSYYDGYLQLPTGNVLYDILGNAQTAGTIRLVDAGLEEDVRLYMGVGCQSLGRIVVESP